MDEHEDLSGWDIEQILLFLHNGHLVRVSMEIITVSDNV